ncbi:uncharacterized protein LOC118205750 [Stegodyphus dumicola]|uniref:uncharacterized protein LOC118205750 n=1 Tax=Stegodyphus dumicola TaxID=202533 RepID=UPI0015B16735|nr:uncharacterized protein LOC118205750 [Stegodyphus dumicola]
MSEFLNNSLQLPFTEKVQHDFSCYVYLGLGWGSFPQERILNIIIAQEGYEAHKVIQYGVYWTHLYIRFKDGVSASKSVASFQQMERIFNAVIVKNLLSALHSIELKKILRPSNHHLYYQPTIARIDAVDKEESLRTPVNGQILQIIQRKFGYPVIRYSMENEVTVSKLEFSTMAEAVGATIAFGLWSKGYETFPNRFYHKIRIFMRRKEANLIQGICAARGIPPATIKLDYFLSHNIVNEAWRCMCGTYYPRPQDSFSRMNSSFVFEEQVQDDSFENGLIGAECQISEAEIVNDSYPSFFERRNLSLEYPFINSEYGVGSVFSDTSDFPGSDSTSLERAHQYAYFSRNIPFLEKEVRPTTNIPREVAISNEPLNFEHPSLPQNQVKQENSHVCQFAPKTDVLPSTSIRPPRMCQDNLHNTRSVDNKKHRRNFDRRNRGVGKEKSCT